MLIVHVHVHVKPEFVEAFRLATIQNGLARRGGRDDGRAAQQRQVQQRLPRRRRLVI